MDKSVKPVPVHYFSLPNARRKKKDFSQKVIKIAPLFLMINAIKNAKNAKFRRVIVLNVRML